jgi:hypothetical protein
MAGFPSESALGQMLPFPQAAHLAAEPPSQLPLGVVERFHVFSRTDAFH